ncbi:hypothetical protein H483_0115200 [Dietzia sp. UCD-THP]|uniref:hypothetical protein n=1 Tax=Dietzia sp. UCD-THP TaxID=1292020 RepID=UPI00036D77D9|nr:hypothetical protein [Dietzia sp. UCD-THP]EYT57622.1 hypothetical protein H483_0115200 [Dietzia sp. UCD-THP]
MPIVTQDAATRTRVRPPGADPVSRVRRMVGSAREHGVGHAAGDGLRELERALDRVDAPVDIRVRGGLGSGRRTLAAALRTRRGWRPTVEDLDVVAAPGRPVGPAPDAEIICLRTAPCRHEEAWMRRPRAHSLLVVATGVDGADPPRWAREFPAVDARQPSDTSLDAVVAFLDRALESLAAVRLARLESELETLAVHDRVGDLAEAALCALGPKGRT